MVDAIKPIYESLTNEELLRFTQNNNESFNQIDWKIAPKTLPASFTTGSIAANITPYTCNEGKRGLLAVFDAIGIKLGPHPHTFAKEEDSIRVEAANRCSLENTREARIARQRLKISADAATKAQEGTLYSPGIGDSV